MLSVFKKTQPASWSLVEDRLGGSSSELVTVSPGLGWRDG